MTQYCTTKQVFDYLNWSKEQPEFVSGEATGLELVDDSGTIASGSIIYLDHNKVIANTLTLSYGASEASVTALTETTHYTVDLDKAKIIITAAGATAIGANNIYAEYEYTSIDNRSAVSDSHVSDLIDRATALFDEEMDRTYQAPTLVIREENIGRGCSLRKYRPRNLQVFTVKDILGTTVTDTGTSLVLSNTTGLESGDYLTVENEILSIDSVDTGTSLTVTRGALGSTASAHTAGVPTVNTVVEVSTTPAGSVPVFNISSYQSEFDIDSETSYYTLLFNSITSEGLYIGQYPEKNVPNRIRFTYKYGALSVPKDIEQACISQVAQWLISSSIAKGLSEGQDGFSPRANEVLSKDTLDILKEHKLLLADYS